MKLLSKFILITALVFITGITYNNLAFSSVKNNFKVAIVDVNEVVKNYDKVNTLKEKQKAEVADLRKFVEDARKKVAEEKDADKKKKLETAYNQELQTRKKAINGEYQKQLADIDKNINLVTSNIAKSNNYDLVLTKNSVLYGGKDITNDVLKALK